MYSRPNPRIITDNNLVTIKKNAIHINLYILQLLEKNMELSEPSLIREMLYQKTVFDSLRYKPEEVLEKILGVMK